MLGMRTETDSPRIQTYQFGASLMSIRERIVQAAYDSDMSEAADIGGESAAQGT